jgi:nucleoside-diphosphate-sugar epimerase
VKVLLAGATGAVGRPLTARLVAAGHQVLALSRDPDAGKSRSIPNVEPIIADALDRDAVLRAVDGLEADVVISELTALKKIPMRHRDMALTDRLRSEGTANLLAAARAVGVRRFVTQSMIYGYGYGDLGDRVLTEEDRFGAPGRGAFELHLAAMRSNEEQTFGTTGIEGVALRYGTIYGPGAGIEEWIDLLRRRRLPAPGGGITSFIHIADAVEATVAALERGRGGEAYNVVDDEPAGWRDVLVALAEATGAPKPLTIPGWFLLPWPYAHAMMTGVIRVSNGKAKRELGWTPSVPTYRDGIRALRCDMTETNRPRVPAAT